MLGNLKHIGEMKLYHYTSISSFELIWKYKTLKFSVSKTTNDFFERNKNLRLTPASFPPGITKEKLESFYKSIFNELESYRQISFSIDKEIKGYANPMMWGQYARTKVEDSWEDGVCIELESSLLKKPTNNFYEGEIDYDKMAMPCLEGFDISNPHAPDEYVSRNQKLLFFTKHKQWEHENEYRLIYKGDEFLDISNAITAIYVLDESPAFDRVKEIVKDESLIYFLRLGGFEDMHLVKNNLKQFNDMKKLLVGE